MEIVQIRDLGPGMEKVGSGINIPDPQHCLQQAAALRRTTWKKPYDHMFPLAVRSVAARADSSEQDRGQLVSSLLLQAAQSTACPCRRSVVNLSLVSFLFLLRCELVWITVCGSGSRDPNPCCPGGYGSGSATNASHPSSSRLPSPPPVPAVGQS